MIGGKMLQLERHNHITALLEQNGAMRVNQIALQLSVSRETIRRDLSALEKKGVVLRSHGGALLVDNYRGVTSLYTAPLLPDYQQQDSFRTRTSLSVETKSKIARKALSFIGAGDTILLDCSSSSWFLSRQLSDVDQTVVTNSTSIIQTLASRKSMRLIGLGGDYSPSEEAFFGEMAAKQLHDMNVETLFFSCQGMDLDRGVFTESKAHAALLHQMFLASKQVVLLADGSKHGKIGSEHICGFGEIDVLITEKFNDPLLEKEMIWHNVKVVNI